MIVERAPLLTLLSQYRPHDSAEAADLDRTRTMVDTEPDPWARSTPLHVTASALIVHPETERVLLRWHEREQAWLQIGGHGDPGEFDPMDVVLREGREESGLPDLRPWPNPDLLHMVIVPVAPRGAEPAHEHADLRFVLATSTPDAVRAETPDAQVRWLTVAEAREATRMDNLRETLARLEKLLAG